MYDAPSYTPSRWLQLAKLEAASSIVEYNSTVPPPGAPNRWTLPNDYTGLYSVAAAYQAVDTIARRLALYNFLNCIIVLSLIMRYLYSWVF